MYLVAIALLLGTLMVCLLGALYHHIGSQIAVENAALPLRLQTIRTELDRLRDEVLSAPGDTSQLREHLDRAMDQWTDGQYSHSVGDMAEAKYCARAAERWLQAVRRDLERARISRQTGWNRLSETTASAGTPPSSESAQMTAESVSPAVVEPGVQGVEKPQEAPSPSAADDDHNGETDPDALDWSEMSEVEKNREVRQRSRQKDSSADATKREQS